MWPPLQADDSRSVPLCPRHGPSTSIRLRASGGIGRDQVAALHYRLHKTPAMANRVVETLSRLFYMAGAWGVAPEGGNPCRFVKKYKDRSCERFLSGTGVPPTGKRAERAGSRWQGFGERCRGVPSADADRVQAQRDPDAPVGRMWTWMRGKLRLRDAKTGARSVALSPAARKVLTTLPRLPDNPWVISGPRPREALEQPERPVACGSGAAELQDVRIHGPATLLRFEGTGAGGEPDDDR